jgi:hypothetical protein
MRLRVRLWLHWMLRLWRVSGYSPTLRKSAKDGAPGLLCLVDFEMRL